MKKSVPFAFYFFYFAAASFSMPFIILYYQGLGYSGPQIGLLASLFPLVMLVGAPTWTRIADARSRHRLVMSITIAVSILIAAVFPFLKDFPLVLAASVLYAFFIAPVMSLADSATIHMLGNEQSTYGRVRIGGTIGWGATALISGTIIQSYGTRWVFWGYALIMVVVFFISQKLSFPTRMAAQSTRGDFKSAFANRQWAVFLLLAVIAGIGLVTINNYLSPYLKELGISQAYMGIALLISTLVELPVMFFSSRLLKRFGTFRLLLLSSATSGVRMLLYAGVNSLQGILFFQLLNGMTFPLFMIAAVPHANEISPEGMKATGQGLMGAAVSGIGASIGGLAAGLLIGSAGGQAMFFSIGLVVLAGVAIVAIVERKRYVKPQPSAVNPD